MEIKSDAEIKDEYLKAHLKEIERKVDLIYNADVMNPEALEMWKQVKNADWIKPDIREKWEKGLKARGITFN